MDVPGQCHPVRVSVCDLLPSDSPRLEGESTAHADALAASATVFPPIVVDRATMRVIDGMHRLRAAMLRGEREIEVQFFDGSAEDAFVLAVTLNVERQGLPLSLADRTAAAGRILGSHRQWSDRAIASVTGLSHKTVGAIRRRSSGEIAQLGARIGRDGRIRPVDIGQRRQRAGELISARPTVPLREIANAVGISLGTARDVRERLRRGEDPSPPAQHPLASVPPRREPPGAAATDDVSGASRAALMRALRGDPSLRCGESGRLLLRLLESSMLLPRQWEHLIDGIPAHCAGTAAAAARHCAQAWLDFADHVEIRFPESPERVPLPRAPTGSHAE
ncbi:MAG TPA: ParB N-terminal domain-containing protein [Actinophytocola sp.]|uniref:ParB N-terminal domain-containing protein n=1 Tax=Actinophytocola sp. TaxID=1872138 RepID=UPI002DBBCACB|nr:ParB N-terminal domain-containing protein [Actinophytocola sp.]HEU5472490.1 ParB N-terminal domain-containing protein [Actinophytocola sp.]